MRVFIKNKKGQFVIIAVLMIAIMIISIGALMHGAVTYYKHEPWEEYLTLISNIELSSNRLVELSLTNYTNSNLSNPNILKENLERWQRNLTGIYPGYGIVLKSELANGPYNVYGATVNYSLGLNCTWYKTTSFSAANASFTLSLVSIGLTEYKFMATALLNLTILNVSDRSINVTVKREQQVPITDLSKDNFQVSNVTNSLTITDVISYHEQKEVAVFTITCSETISTPVTVKVWDERGIQTTAKYP